MTAAGPGAPPKAPWGIPTAARVLPLEEESSSGAERTAPVTIPCDCVSRATARDTRSRRARELNLPDNWSQWTVCPLCRTREPRHVEERKPQCRFCNARGSVVYVHWIESEWAGKHSRGSEKAPVQKDGRRW